jgi:hypothetical protein
MECVAVVLHTSVSVFSSIDSSGEKGLLCEGSGEGGGVFFVVLSGGGEDIFLSSLYIKEGFLKYLDVDGTSRWDVRRWMTCHLIPGGAGGREGLLGGREEGLGFVLEVGGGTEVVCGGDGEVLVGERREMALSTVLRRVLRFLLDILNKVIIVLFIDVLLFVCWLLL